METYKQAHSTLIGKGDQQTTDPSDSSAVVSKDNKKRSSKNRRKARGTGSGSHDLDLLFGAIVFHFNQIFEDELGRVPLDSNFEPSSDLSVTSISERIVTSTTGVFRSYADLHPELSEENALYQFMNMVYESIEMAFSDIKELLDSYHQLDEETTSALETVNDIVTEKHEEFVNSFGFFCNEIQNETTRLEREDLSHYLWSHELHTH